MPFQRPTRAQLIERVEGEVATRLGTGPLLPRSVLVALARVIAGTSHELHGHLDWLARNLLPDQAEREELERWAELFGITRKAAAFAVGTVKFTGTTGLLVPAGTVLRRADGARFATDVDGTIATTDVDVAVTAALAGLAGDTPEGTLLRLVSPIAGLANTAEVLEPGIVDGAEQETDEELRARLLQRLREPPQGGAERDYSRWALEVQGVTRAWAFRNYYGLGTVGVAIATDDDPTGPTPTPSKVDEVAAYIEDGRRPVTAQVTVFGPPAFPIDLEIELTPDDPVVREQVALQLGDLLRREAVPGEPVLVSHLHEAISTATGELDHVLHSPVANVDVPRAALPVLGSIIWS